MKGVGKIEKERSVKTNLPIPKERKEGDDMCQALLEVMKPEIDKIREDEKKRGKIMGLVEAFREVGKSNQEIEKLLVQKYGLREDEVPSYL